MKLSERAMLVTLHRGFWGGTRHDQDVTEEAAANHKADAKDSGRYTKQLISKKALKNLSAKMSMARTTHRVLTLPWDDDGTRILTSRGYMHYTQQMGLLKRGVEDAVRAFAKEYPDHIKHSKLRLGSMFDESEYPDISEIKKKFYIDVEVKPIPEASDFRTKLADDNVKAIAKDIEERTNQRIQNAVNDVFERVIDVTSKMKSRLREYENETGKKGAGFRNSLVCNISELTELLPILNINNDKRLEELTKQLKNDLVTHSAEKLKSDPELRKQAISAADRIIKKAKSYLA